MTIIPHQFLSLKVIWKNCKKLIFGKKGGQNILNFPYIQLVHQNEAKNTKNPTHRKNKNPTYQVMSPELVTIWLSSRNRQQLR